MKFVGLRFFTVYGEWGRPDMMILKYIEASIKKKIFYLNNYGNHTRDFTYISDVIQIMNKLMCLKVKKNHEIFNICSNRPIKLVKIINLLSSLTNAPKIKKIAFQKGDVLKTVPEYTKKNKSLKICLLNVDIDFVESTQCVLENFYEKVIKGGVIIFDNYKGNIGNRKSKIFYRGETNTINQFLKKKGKKIKFSKLFIRPSYIIK